MGKFLFRIAKLEIMGAFVGFALAYCPFLVPVKKIMQNKYAISFMHPSAVYPDHILIIPRRIVQTVFCLSNKDILEIIEMAIKIRQDDNRDCVLMINGGKKQDVMQAHFHLFTGNLIEIKKLSNKIGSSFLLQDKQNADITIGSSLHSLLRQHNISEESFSLIIQFKKDADLSIYLL